MNIAMAQRATYDRGMKIAELIRQERERRGWSARKLAAKAEVDPAAISKIENGQQIGHAITLAKIAQALDINPSLLQGVVCGGDDVRLPEARSLVDTLEEALAQARRTTSTRYEVLPGRVIMVPMVSSLTAAGEGAVAEAEPWPYQLQPGEVDHGQRFAVKVKGGCLSPRIQDGETAVIDKLATPTLGNIVAVQVDGESLLRILADGELIALNGHAPIPLSERVHVEGVVVFAGGKP